MVLSDHPSRITGSTERRPNAGRRRRSPMNDPRGLPMDAMDESGGPGFSIGRRRLLTYAVSAAVVTIAAGFGVNLATPSSAVAAATPLSPAVALQFSVVGGALVLVGAPSS